MSPIKPKRSQYARQEQHYQDKTNGQNCSAETNAALSPIVVTVAITVFTILKTRGTTKRKRLIQNMAHGYQAVNVVPKASVREPPSAVLAEVVDPSGTKLMNPDAIPSNRNLNTDTTDLSDVVKNVAIQQDPILIANQEVDDPFVAQELEYVDGRLPVAISFELPGKLVPIDSDESIYELEDDEEQDGDSISSSVSSSSEDSSEKLQALQSNAHARAPTTERRAAWTAARADAATNWRERRDEERPRVAANGWQAINAYLGRASPEKRPARQMPTRLAPEWTQDNQVRANA